MTFDPDRLARIDAGLNRFVEAGQLPGWHVSVLDQDEVAYSGMGGVRCIDSAAAVAPDTIWRIYSMTKPVAALAALMLWEEGRFDLHDPIAEFLPEFADSRVWQGGSPDAPQLAPAEPIRIWHLMTHTAGLTFAQAADHPIAALYLREGLDWAGLQEMSLAEACLRIARQPLMFQPGASWGYSVSIDVLGRLVEVVSGEPFDRFLARRIFEPLGMVDTGFDVPADQADRLASLHLLEGRGKPLKSLQAPGARVLRPASGAYGGAGLVSTMADYLRFARMLGRWGELDGARLVSRRTLQMATVNHLPGGAMLHDFARPLLGNREPPGVGFCLLGSVTVDPTAAKSPVGAGTYGWPGAAGTTFWIDPTEGVACVLMAQVMTTERSVIRDRLKTLVYQALT